MRRNTTAAAAALRMVKAVVSDLETELGGLIGAMQDNLAGYPRTSGHAGVRASGNISDPTGIAALESDHAAADLEHLFESIDGLAGWAKEVDHLRVAWLPRRSKMPPCANANGCPSAKLAAPGRGGRCEGCYRAKQRTGVDRAVSRVRAA